METINVKIMNKGPHPSPKYSTKHSAGMDLRAWIKSDDYRYDKEVILYPLERAMIHTGIYIALPEGYECQIRPRSGMALKRGLSVLNTPGTIDADYRGEICVIVVNLSNEVQKIEDGKESAKWSFPSTKRCLGFHPRHSTKPTEVKADLVILGTSRFFHGFIRFGRLISYEISRFFV